MSVARVRRDDDLLRFLLPHLRAFWQHAQTGDEFELDLDMRDRVAIREEVAASVSESVGSATFVRVWGHDGFSLHNTVPKAYLLKARMSARPLPPEPFYLLWARFIDPVMSRNLNPFSTARASTTSLVENDGSRGSGSFVYCIALYRPSMLDKYMFDALYSFFFRDFLPIAFWGGGAHTEFSGLARSLLR
jgi:hypothetical protein